MCIFAECIMKALRLILFIIILGGAASASADRILIETESFTDKGGWVTDQQFMEKMGSPYLLAHGLGRPVDDASTAVDFAHKGRYKVYVRTFNWTSPWSDKKGPGRFRLLVNGKNVGGELGCEGNRWMWQYAGEVNIPESKKQAKVVLRDLSGFDGRCDAVYFTDEGDVPPEEADALARFRENVDPHPVRNIEERYDLVVVGGGVAGISAAVSAARLGQKVALVNDRPVLGGNNSSEIRVHLGGRIEAGPYKRLGDLQKEFGPLRQGNAQPADYYEDHKKQDFVDAEKNITLYPSYRVIAAETADGRIKSVTAQHINSGDRISLSAPLFADCTGDGSVGALAGADWRMGREARSEYGEPSAPEVADSLTLGASVQWYSVKSDKPVRFPEFEYGLNFNEESAEPVVMGEWTWETGMNVNQIENFERIRDYGLMVVYSNWSYLKNRYGKRDDFACRKLDWVAYISGKRESRRLLGDYVLKEDDLIKHVAHEDATGATTWSIDLHYPDSINSVHFPDAEFKSIAIHKVIHPYPVPFRCLYSRNVDNLFMAGRDISVTHIALGTTRVMRTTGILGEVVGMAAKICNDHGVMPRQLYQRYLPELKKLMAEGVGDASLPNNQQYNEGSTLGDLYK